MKTNDGTGIKYVQEQCIEIFSVLVNLGLKAWTYNDCYFANEWRYKTNQYNFNLRSEEKKNNFFFKNLYKIGYRYFSLKKRKIKKDKKIIKAFQLRFLPKRVSGNLDQKTLKISYYLANSYNILKKS